MVGWCGLACVPGGDGRIGTIINDEDTIHLASQPLDERPQHVQCWVIGDHNSNDVGRRLREVSRLLSIFHQSTRSGTGATRGGHAKLEVFVVQGKVGVVGGIIAHHAAPALYHVLALFLKAGFFSGVSSNPRVADSW